MSTSTTIDAQRFTSALALAANSVSVVTTDGAHGRAGLTVSSMCSVCAEPALVLACVNRDNEFCAVADANGQFAINMLTTQQSHIALVFAGLGENPETNRFLTGSWQMPDALSPQLSDALVSMQCELESASNHGTHRLYIGRVTAIQSTDAAPLVYIQRNFAQTIDLDAQRDDNRGQS